MKRSNSVDSVKGRNFDESAALLISKPQPRLATLHDRSGQRIVIKESEVSALNEIAGRFGITRGHVQTLRNKDFQMRVLRHYWEKHKELPHAGSWWAFLGRNAFIQTWHRHSIKCASRPKFRRSCHRR